jgi:streptogramin lyase
MTVAKAFMKAWGLVSVGAVECETTTLPMTNPRGDVAVDSKGNVYFTDWKRERAYMCPENVWMWGECKALDRHFGDPDGIAVDASGAVPVVYVSEGIPLDTAPKVHKCSWHIGQSEEWFNCSDFGGSNASWTLPHGLAVDSEGNVFITYHYDFSHGVWKCSPSAVCASVGGTDLWLHNPPERVAVDSQGNVYVSGYYEPDLPYEHKNASYVKKCTSTGACADFGGDWPRSGGGHAIAVGSDDTVYITDSGGTDALIRCSPDNVCERVDVGAFQGAKSMAIDRNNALYIMDDDGLHRFCLSPSMNDIQV